MEGDRLLVGHGQDERPAQTILGLPELGDGVAPARLPELRRRDDRHEHLLPADRVDLLPDDLHRLLVDAPAERQERPEAGAHLADEAAANEQAVARRLGIARVFPQRREEELGGPAHQDGRWAASAIMRAAGLASFRRFGLTMPPSIHVSISRKSSVDEEVRLDLPEHATVRVDEAGLAPARDAEVGVAGLARAVHRAAHHRDLERLRVGAQPLLDRLGQGPDADVVAPARGAGDHDRPALAQAERLQDLPGDLDLLDRVGGERDPDRVADPVHEQAADADGALDRPRRRRARLGDAEVERVRHLLGRASGTRGSSSAPSST